MHARMCARGEQPRGGGSMDSEGSDDTLLPDVYLSC